MLFKVYIVGDTIKVVRKFSLPDVDESESLGYGVIPFPRVSSATASADEADLDPHVGGEAFLLSVHGRLHAFILHLDSTEFLTFSCFE